MNLKELTMLKIIGFPYIDAYQSHQLKLREPLSCWRWQGQKISQVGNFCIDEISTQLRCAFGGLGRVETEKKEHWHEEEDTVKEKAEMSIEMQLMFYYDERRLQNIVA